MTVRVLRYRILLGMLHVANHLSEGDVHARTTGVRKEFEHTRQQTSGTRWSDDDFKSALPPNFTACWNHLSEDDTHAMLPGQQEWEGSWSTPGSKPLAPSEDRLGLCCNKDFKGALPPDSAACAAHGKPPSPSWRWRVPCCLDYSSVWDSSWNRDKAANMGIKPTSTSLLEIVRSDLSFQWCRAHFFFFFPVLSRPGTGCLPDIHDAHEWTHIYVGQMLEQHR